MMLSAETQWSWQSDEWHELLYSGEEKQPGADQKHTVVFPVINMEPFKQAGRQAGAGAHRQQGALHPVHMPGDGWGKQTLWSSQHRPAKATQRRRVRSRWAAVTCDNRMRISLRFRSIRKYCRSPIRQPPLPPFSDPHTPWPRMDRWMDGWRV